MKLNVQASHQQKFSINVDPQTLIKDLKIQIIETNKDKEGWQRVEISNIRVIFSGRILKDEETVESYKLSEDCTIHIVKSGIPKPPTEQPSAPASSSFTTQSSIHPPSMSSSMGTAGAANNTTGIQSGGITIESLLQSMSAAEGGIGSGNMPPLSSGSSPTGFNPMDPQFRLQALQMLSQNPELLRTVLESSPFMQQIPPEMRPHLSNPVFLQQVSQLLSTMSPEREAQILQEMRQHGFPSSRMSPFMMDSMTPNITDINNNNNDSSSNSTEPPEVRFQSQLSQLNDMGFFDPEENIRCLLATSGNVSAAVELLLRNNFPTQ